MRPCGCTVTTPLDKLCPSCLSKAWAYADQELKRDLIKNEGFLRTGARYEIRRDRHGKEIDLMRIK